MEIGAQLYTVRQYTQNLDDFAATLKKVAAMGFKSVQVSLGAVCPFEPEWLRDQLQENGLVCAVTHVKNMDVVEKLDEVVKNHAVFGCRNIGIGGMPGPMKGSLEGYAEFCKMYIPAAEKMRDLGVKFQYHNHEYEFNKVYGTSVMERMMEDFPADSVDFTLDVGWADFAGADVLKLIDTMSGRLSRVHLKDYADIPEDGSIKETRAYLRPIYEGKAPYDIYIPALQKAGCEYALIEQDNCYGEDPMACLERSLKNIKARGIL